MRQRLKVAFGKPKRSKKFMVALTDDEAELINAKRGTVPASVYIREKALS